MKNWLKKNRAVIIIAPILFYLGLIVFNSMRIDMRQFEKSSRALLEKSEILKDKAAAFNQKNALEKLESSAINGFYYRFDDHIKDAICKKSPSHIDGVPAVTKIFALEFEGNDPVKFEAKKGAATIKNGVLALTYHSGGYLETVEDIDIAKDSIGEIELRIKLKRAKRIELGWTKYSQVDYNYQTERGTSGIGKVLIETIPDNRFHTYTVNASNALKDKLDPGGVIKKIFLVPSHVTHDEVEIDYIRFIPRKAKYSRNPCGDSYEEINNETRKALYMNTPLSLKYKLPIPKGESFLSFGMGILEDAPVTFRIRVRDGHLQRELFSQKVIEANQWYDAKINFSEWSGKNIEIVLEAESDTGNVAFWSNPILYTPAKERFNIIIVTEDALRADHLSCYGYARRTTPVKDEWIKNGVLFLNAFAQATETRPSYPSLMTSLYPTAIGTGRYIEMLDDTYLTLAEIMRHQGFLTASFTQNENTGACAGTHQGFSYLFDRGVGERAQDIYCSKELYELIKSNMDRNFFLVLHLLDPHWPYDPPEPFDLWYKEAPQGKVSIKRLPVLDPPWVVTPTLEGRKALYDGEVRCNDFYFKNFLKMLKENELLDDTLLIFSADHGEYLSEHERWGHAGTGYIQVLHVPLMMVYPKRLPKGVKIIQPVQLIDIMPTVLDLANIKKANFLLQGESLVPLIYGKNLDFWNNRLTISEEEMFKGDKYVGASLFYKNWHMLTSRELITRELSKAGIYDNSFIGKLARICPTFVGLRLFNYLEDKEEMHHMNTFSFDLFFKYRVGCFLKKLQENNAQIRRALTKDTEEKIRYDPEAQERLRALGYLQ